MWKYTYSDELYHYGVKGMKWGVRRYQNFDGSYTKAGLKRFNNSLEKYEQANSRYKTAKKNGTSKAELTNSRLERKSAKKQLKKDYKHLSQDKLGDQGKSLYAKGRRITGNNKAAGILAAVGTMSTGLAAYNYKNGTLGNQNVTTFLSSIGAASTTVAGIKMAKNYNDAQKLRAYYGHTSNY